MKKNPIFSLDKNPELRKHATFAESSKKWKHEEGAKIHKPFGHRSILDNGWQPNKELKKKTTNRD